DGYQGFTVCLAKHEGCRDSCEVKQSLVAVTKHQGKLKTLALLDLENGHVLWSRSESRHQFFFQTPEIFSHQVICFQTPATLSHHVGRFQTPPTRSQSRLSRPGTLVVLKASRSVVVPSPLLVW